MKSIIYLATIISTVLIGSTLVKAQGYPYGGSLTTTIYVPSIETTTTTTTTQINPIVIYPSNNSVGTSTLTNYGSYPIRQRRQYRQPTVIIQQQNIYPSARQSTCSTSIIGSPIPSPIALDRSGQPCR
jgi:hypothetical protein